MQLRVSLNRPDGPATDLLVDADPASPVRELGEQIARALGVGNGTGSGPVDGTGEGAHRLYLDGVEVPAGIPLHQSPIRDGAELGLGTPAPAPPPAQGIVEVRVVGGPEAGEVHRLGPGAVTVGGAATDGLRIADPTVPAAALTLLVAPDGTATITPAGTAAITLESDSIR